MVYRRTAGNVAGCAGLLLCHRSTNQLVLPTGMAGCGDGGAAGCGDGGVAGCDGGGVAGCDRGLVPYTAARTPASGAG